MNVHNRIEQDCALSCADQDGKLSSITQFKTRQPQIHELQWGLNDTVNDSKAIDG